MEIRDKSPNWVCWVQSEPDSCWKWMVRLTLVRCKFDSLMAFYFCTFGAPWLFHPGEPNREEKPAIGQFLWRSLPSLTNDRDTKREKMMSVSFVLLWSEKCKQNYAQFWTELGYKLKTEKCKPFRDRRSEILNNGSTQNTAQRGIFSGYLSPMLHHTLSVFQWN